MYVCVCVCACVCVCVYKTRCWHKYFLGYTVKQLSTVYLKFKFNSCIVSGSWLRQTISEFFLLQLQLARKSGKLCLKPTRLIASHQSFVMWTAACSGAGRSELNPATQRHSMGRQGPRPLEVAGRSGTRKLAPRSLEAGLRPQWEYMLLSPSFWATEGPALCPWLTLYRLPCIHSPWLSLPWRLQPDAQHPRTQVCSPYLHRRSWWSLVACGALLGLLPVFSWPLWVGGLSRVHSLVDFTVWHCLPSERKLFLYGNLCSYV